MTHKVIEWDYYSKVKRVDPFNEVSLSVKVVLDKKIWNIPAFWRGGDKWSVRFSSGIFGTYSVQTSCSDVTDLGLHDVLHILQIEKSECEDVSLEKMNLQVSSNKCSLEYENGKPFFWLGDTWWMGLSKRLTWPEDFKELTQDRKNKGFTTILLVAGLFPDMDLFDERGSNEGGFPWTEDCIQINPAFFDEADKRIDWLIQSGLRPCILGSWGYYISKMGVEKIQKHWKYIVARWGAMPVIWCLAGEAAMPYYLSSSPMEDKEQQLTGWTHIGQYIKKLDPFSRLITIHPIEVGRDEVTNEKFLDFNFLQAGHSGYKSISNMQSLIMQEKMRQPLMPILIGEVNYEGIIHNTQAEVQRLTFWSAILLGVAGFTYGANGIWQVNTQKKAFGPSPHGGTWGNLPWNEAYKLKGAKEIALAKQFLMHFDWWNLSPHPEWIFPQEDILLTKTPRIAGIYGKLRIIYFYGPVQPSIAAQYKLLCLEAQVEYKAFFWDPRIGKEYPLGIVIANENGEWDIPPLPTLEDWILVLESVPIGKLVSYDKKAYSRNILPNMLKWFQNLYK